MFAAPGGDNHAFLKLTNTGASTLNLQDCSLFGVGYTFGAVTLAAGESLVLVKNLSAYFAQYGDPGIQVLQWTSGNLSNNGEYLALLDSNNKVILSFYYNGKWFDEAAYFTGLWFIASDLGIPGTDEIWSTPAAWHVNVVAPVITGIWFEAGDLVITYESVLPVSVEYKNNLGDLTWEPCPFIEPTNGKLVIDIQALDQAQLSTSRFFRLVVP